MRKDKIDIVSSELPGASFYIIEDYLRVHLQPYLKRFHTGLDIQSRKKIMNILQFLEALTYLSDIFNIISIGNIKDCLYFTLSYNV